MQTSLELSFSAYFTLKYAEYDGGLCTMINFSYAVVFTVLLLAFSILTFCFYRKNVRIIQGTGIVHKNINSFHESE